MVDDGSAHIVKFRRNQFVKGTLGNGQRNGEAKEGETEIESESPQDFEALVFGK